MSLLYDSLCPKQSPEARHKSTPLVVNHLPVCALIDVVARVSCMTSLRILGAQIVGDIRPYLGVSLSSQPFTVSGPSLDAGPWHLRLRHGFWHAHHWRWLHLVPCVCFLDTHNTGPGLDLGTQALC